MAGAGVGARAGAEAGARAGAGAAARAVTGAVAGAVAVAGAGTGAVAVPAHALSSRSSAVMHVTPELEVLGSNPGGVGTQCPRR